MLFARKEKHADPHPRAGMAQSGDRIPNLEWGRDLPHSSWPALYNGYRVSFPGVKRPGRGVKHPPDLVARLKKE